MSANLALLPENFWSNVMQINVYVFAQNKLP